MKLLKSRHGWGNRVRFGRIGYNTGVQVDIEADYNLAHEGSSASISRTLFRSGLETSSSSLLLAITYPRRTE